MNHSVISDIRSAEYLFVSDGFELFLEVGRQIRQRLVEAAGGVVEQVAQQQFRDRIGAEIISVEWRPGTGDRGGGGWIARERLR